MRKLGDISSLDQAQRFSAVLAAGGIANHVQPTTPEGPATLWIIEEDHLPAARAELDAFRADPQAARFLPGAKPLANARPAAAPTPARPRRARPRATEGAVWRRFPVTFFVAVAAVLVTFLTAAGANSSPLSSELSIASWTKIATPEGIMVTWENLADLRAGQLWRLFTPALLHFSPLHLLFNVMWLWIFGNEIEYRRGSWRLLGIILLTAAASNFAEYWLDVGLNWEHGRFVSETGVQPSPTFGGLSGVNFGLFGFIWIRARLLPRSTFVMPPDTVVWMLLWLVVCTTGLFGPIANVCHGVGLLTGMALGAAPRLWHRA